jgi:hypothetical protein
MILSYSYPFSIGRNDVNTKIFSATLSVVATLMCQGAFAEDTIYIGKAAPFTDTTTIAKNILEECKLPESQMQYLRELGEELDINVVEDEAAVSENKGKVLIVETFNAISTGNAFSGHKKQVIVKGKLLENGNEIGNFTGIRGSGGGVFGGYKSSCAVLHRCQAALAKDILNWTKQPAKDSRIGE